MISLLLILFFVSISFASADDLSDIEITDNDEVQEIEEISMDVVDDTNTPEKNVLSASNEKTFADLRSQISKASSGDTIVLDSNYVYNSGFTNNGITIDKTLTIDGKGHTLNAKKSGRIFSIAASNVVLKNIIFTNGYKDDGAGAISGVNAKKITIMNCTFKNNGAGAIGGAVFLKNDNHKITGCTFVSNTATKSGGAIRLQGNKAVIEKCTFKNNKVTGSDFLGGAVCALGNYITVKNNVFENNVASRDGGALDIEGSDVEKIGKHNVVENNTFTNNSAKYGGAISANCQNITITKNTFSKNHATSLGGAIRIAGTKTNTGKITLNSFNGDYAPSGGAIFIDGNQTTVSQNTFKSNKATTGSGGAINIRGNKNVVTKNSITSASAKEVGGAIYQEGTSFKLTYNNITKSKSSKSGGAAYINGNSASIQNNVFANNGATAYGGAINIKSNNAVLKSNDFEANTAGKTGKSVNGQGTKPTISNNNLINVKSQSGIIVWSNYNVPKQNIVKKSNTTQNNTTKPEETVAENTSIVDNRTKTKIIYEDMQTGPIQNKDERTGNYFCVQLIDENDNILAGLPIKIGFNGVIYNRTTDSEGGARLQINLASEDKYTFAISFLGDDGYQAAFEVALIDVSKNYPAPNKANSTTNATKLNVTKDTNRTKTYIQYSDMVTTSVLKVDGRAGEYFYVKLLDHNKNALTGAPIKIGFNGVIYNRTTDSSGQARLQINLLKVTKYTFAISYLGSPVRQASFEVAKITVKAQTPKLSAAAKTFKASAKTKSVSATLLSAKGNPIKNQKLNFTVNGKTYAGTTNSNGVATVNISLNKKGTYSCSIKFAGMAGCNAKTITSTVKIT